MRAKASDEPLGDKSVRQETVVMGYRSVARTLRKTWNTAAVINEYKSPMTALLTSQKLRMRICIRRKTTIGINEAIIAAAQIGIISLRIGYANSG